jgi:ribosomal protein S27E
VTGADADALEPAAGYGTYVLVHCPACNQRAIVRDHQGGLRLTCGHCGHAQTAARPRMHFEPHPDASLDAYNKGRLPFNARLWLEAECCGGNRLWALNERHLDYIERFVKSKDRDGEFPSLPGNRQLSDKFPAWLVSRQHRAEVTRAISRLRSTL